MAAKKGLLVWEGARGSPPANRSRSVVGEVIDLSHLLSFRTIIGARSKCVVRVATFSTSVLSTVALVPDTTVDRQAIIYFRHPFTLQVHRMAFPDPVDSIVEEKPEGTRIKAADVSMIVGFINTATGESYIPLKGVVIKKR